jgi:O-antigen ligase
VDTVRPSLLSSFLRIYPRVVYYGLISLIWFSALSSAAYDLWAATVFFSVTTLLTLVFEIGRWLDRAPIKAPLAAPLLLFLGALSLSTWNSYDLDTTHLEVWGWAFAVLAFYLYLNTVESEQDQNRFFTLAGAVVVPLALICLWQRFVFPASGHTKTLGLFGYGLLELNLGWIRPGLKYSYRYGNWEIHATLINSIVLAGFVLYWTPFFWKRAIENKRFRFLFLACLMALFFARSWWALLVLLLGFALDHYEILKATAARNKKSLILVLLPAFLCLGSIAYIKTHHRVADHAHSDSYHPQGRWAYWSAAWEMWQRHPWSGVGLGAYAAAYPFFRTPGVENTRLAHGFPIQMLAETGTAGIAAWLLLLIQFLRLRSRKQSIYETTLVMILVYSAISIHMDYLLNKVVFLIFVAAAVRAVRSEEYRMPPLWIAGTGACLILASAFWLPLLPASRRYESALYYEHTGDIQKAVRLYQDAIALNPHHADSHWRMAQFYRSQYEKTRSPEDLTAAQSHMRQALHNRKDVRFIDEHADIEKQ